ncbi:hypothetical protein JB92DRAFT_1997665 [Gautieria morchelliformis]|nr:hypothetical protein JB92DRAFT_1997665 [Gautieria morchelliformis]
MWGVGLIGLVSGAIQVLVTVHTPVSSVDCDDDDRFPTSWIYSSASRSKYKTFVRLKFGRFMVLTYSTMMIDWTWNNCNDARKNYSRTMHRARSCFQAVIRRAVIHH